MSDPVELARREAVLVPALGWDCLIVTGPDRVAWLEGLVTCELKQLAPGAGAWGLLLNRQGKIQSTLWVVASPDSLWLATAPGTGDAVFGELGRMLIMEDAELERASAPQRWFALHGPEAGARAAELAQVASGHAGVVDWLGIGGAALVVPEGESERVLGAMRGAVLDATAWARLRIERGLPEFGHDYDGKDRPHEAALDRRAVSWSKGCYLGQEVVCMQDMRGKVKRSLRLLALDAPRDAAIAPGGAIVPAAGEPAGKVTSAAYSERAGSWLALAKLDLDATGGPLFYVADGLRVAARLSDPV